MNTKICISKKLTLLILIASLTSLIAVFLSNSLMKKSTTVKTRAEEVKSTNSIMYGVPAEENEFPYFALILIRTDNVNAPTSFCGGSLIGEEWVLTAAHCVIDKEPTDLMVILGLNRINSPLYAQSYSPVSQIITRPDYVRGKLREQINNDIALLRLAKKASGVPAISIPNPDSNGDTFIDPNEFPENKYIGNNATILGFGIREDKFISLSLLKGKLKVERGKSVPPDKIYLPTPEDGTTACRGDSGGPLIMVIDGKPQVIGVSNSSGGLPDNTCFIESLYTSVARYAEWIRRITQIPYASGTFSTFGPPYFYPPQSIQESFCTESSEYSDCDFKYFFCNWFGSCKKCASRELPEGAVCK